MKEYMKRCKENEIAFCMAECPFKMDVREFIGKLKRGRFKAAYRTFQNAVVFPSIVSELCLEYCKKVCPRKDVDGAIELKQLEKATLRYSNKKEPIEFNLPAKNKKIAIVGGGLCGLACAIKLCEKGYTVSIFEKNNRLGGEIRNLVDDKIIDEEIAIQMKYVMPEILLNTEIFGIDDKHLVEFEAVLFCTGKKTDFESNNKKIFKAGAMTGFNLIEAIADGINVAVDIETYLLTGRALRANRIEKTKLIPREIDNIETCYPQNKREMDKDDVKYEAERCLMCSCDFCQRGCDLIEYFNKSPLKMMDEVRGTTQLESVVTDITVATKLIASCNQCGVCKEVCPEGIDFQYMFLEARRMLYKKGKLPWVFNDFLLRDVKHAEENCFFYSPVHDTNVEYLFFPGCQIGASNPEYVIKSYKWLLQQNRKTAIYVNCCGAPYVWAGKEDSNILQIQGFERTWKRLGKPTVLFACSNCMRFANERYADMNCKMLYSYMVEMQDSLLDNEFQGIYNNKFFSVFDPCSARNDPEVWAAVRKLVKFSGAKLKSLKIQCEDAKCCGFGGNPVIANPEYVEKVVNKRIRESEFPYIVYCSNCKDIFRHYGKKALHILDVVFGIDVEDEKEITMSQRHYNREVLKHILNKTYLNNDMIAYKQKGNSMKEKVIISSDLKKKLSSAYILEEDVIRTIEYCEKHNRKMIYNDDIFVGHLKVGHMTYWVEYRVEKEKILLLNAYSHRISILGDEEYNG